MTATALSFPTRAPEATAPESAKVLKATLRAAFPATKFSVQMSRGTAYGSVTVSWVDGPSVRAVDAIAQAFSGKSFDGSDDSTRYHARIMPNGEISGLGYVHSQRTTSPAFARRLAAQVSAFYGVALEVVEDSRGNWSLKNDNARIGDEFASTLMHQAAGDATRFAR